MSENELAEIKRRLQGISSDERRIVFALLREEFPIHDLEAEFGTTAEVILEAIGRSPDLTKRGVRGVVAEAVFAAEVLPTLRGWSSLPFTGDQPFDFALTDGAVVRVQVKMQRREIGLPKRSPSGTMYVVETQKTRGGTSATGEKTRPYRYGDFDILAVCMQPSTNSWSTFNYSVQRWLIPSPVNGAYLRTMQYIPLSPNADWTEDFAEAVRRLRANEVRLIADDVTERRRRRGSPRNQ